MGKCIPEIQRITKKTGKDACILQMVMFTLECGMTTTPKALEFWSLLIKAGTKDSFIKVTSMELANFMKRMAIIMKDNGRITCVMAKASKYISQSHKCIKVNLPTM
jgi:hypothetical protein